MTTNNLETTLAQANLEAKADTDDLVEETDFDDTLKNLNKKLNSNKTRHAEAVRKLTDITEKSKQMSEKNIWFFVRQDVFFRFRWLLNFFSFTPIFSSLIMDINKKITNWISTEISSAKITLMLTLNRPYLIEPMGE